jgi:hypothetical protein
MLESWYEAVSYAGNTCRVHESQRMIFEQVMEFFSMQTVMPPPPGEGEMRSWIPCDFNPFAVYEDPEAPGQFILCQGACMNAKDIAAREFERYLACLDESGSSSGP